MLRINRLPLQLGLHVFFCICTFARYRWQACATFVSMFPELYSFLSQHIFASKFEQLHCRVKLTLLSRQAEAKTKTTSLERLRALQRKESYQILLTGKFGRHVSACNLLQPKQKHQRVFCKSFCLLQLDPSSLCSSLKISTSFIIIHHRSSSFIIILLRISISLSSLSISVYLYMQLQ